MKFQILEHFSFGCLDGILGSAVGCGRCWVPDSRCWGRVTLTFQGVRKRSWGRRAEMRNIFLLLTLSAIWPIWAVADNVSLSLSTNFYQQLALCRADMVVWKKCIRLGLTLLSEFCPGVRTSDVRKQYSFWRNCDSEFEFVYFPELVIYDQTLWQFWIGQKWQLIVQLGVTGEKQPTLTLKNGTAIPVLCEYYIFNW